MQMRWTLGWMTAALLSAAACGSGLGSPQEGNGGSGASPAGAGGNGAALGGSSGKQDDVSTGPGTPEPSQAATGGSGGGGGSGGSGLIPSNDAGTDANLELCPGRAQDAQAVLATIGGANTTASATAAREFLLSLGQSPRPADLWTQDFLNYYAPSFPEANGPEPRVHIQLRKSQIAPYYDLMVAIVAPALQSRPPARLTLVVDNTESLTDAGLARAKRAIAALASNLTVSGDAVTLVSAAADAEITRYELPGDAAALAAAVDALGLAPERPLNELVTRAYQDAGANKQADAWNRVVLVSDGEGDPDAVGNAITSAPAIRLVAIGTGPELRFGHRVLRSASRVGRGAYVHVDSDTEADALEGRFDRLFGVALDDLSLNLTVPWYFDVERPFPVEYSQPGQIEPQYLAPGGTAVFLFRLVACDVLAPKLLPDFVTATAHYTPADGQAPAKSSESLGVTTLLTSSTQQLAKAYAVFGYAEALATLDAKRLAYAHDLVTNALGQHPNGDPELSDIAALLLQHPGYPKANQQ